MIRRPGFILFLLTGLNFLNYLDRIVVSAVLPKFQEELGMSNFAAGALATVFLVGYMVTAPIFGALGDRMDRKWLIALGVVVWSVATVASGLATSVAGLVAARAVVGVGEASYATLAPTIIDDITEPDRKGRALAYFYAATPVGGACGYLVGGFVESHWGWRHAFYVAGGPGVVLALVCLLIAEPKRTMAKEKPSVTKDFGTLSRTPLYVQAVLGYSAYTFTIGAFSYWAPKFIYARYGMELGAANKTFGSITVVGGLLATFIGGFWADRTRKRVERESSAEDAPTDTIKGLLRICAIGSLLGAPLVLGAFLSPTASMFFLVVFFAILVLFMCTSPINAIILGSVPPWLRASAMALSILSIHVLGDAWSPALVGLLADHLPIELAMMILPLAIAVSAVLWWPRRGVRVVASP